jgi:acetate kinase
VNGSVLVFNAGSSSLKYAAWPVEAAAARQERGGSLRPLWRRRTEGSSVSVAEVLHGVLGDPGVAPVRAVGHRIVHGGPSLSGPVRVDGAVLAELDRLATLAPLHQPQGVDGIRAAARILPGVPQVACFDTAFHTSQPSVAQAYALPAAIRERGLRRYGFHGLSCEHALTALAGIAPAPVARGRLIIAHLGAGASLTAVREGRSVANSMGFSPLDGLPMASRCGAIDPGVLLWLMRAGYDADALERLLYRQSGLLGLSGSSGDVRDLLAREAEDRDARFALEYFVYRTVREAGSLAAALGGLDALVFTGGIGEHSPAIRERIAAGLAWLGLEIDHEANRRGEHVVGAPRAAAGCYVIAADEESVIATAVLRLLHES